MCEFYKEQIFDEVLVEPILNLAIEFIDLLNSIPSGIKERFKAPFSETLFKNTERLQMTLRRALFTIHQPDRATNDVILVFFSRLEKDLPPNVNLLQKNVTQSYEKARRAYERFNRVHGYRL